jgi:hypothetical protein
MASFPQAFPPTPCAHLYPPHTRHMPCNFFFPTSLNIIPLYGTSLLGCKWRNNSPIAAKVSCEIMFNDVHTFFSLKKIYTLSIAGLQRSCQPSDWSKAMNLYWIIQQMLEGVVTTGTVLVWFFRHLGLYVSELWVASCTDTVCLVFLSYVKVNNLFLFLSSFSVL